jgi:hypothetical protein
MNLGLPTRTLFDTLDLHEEKDMNKVLQQLHNLHKHVDQINSPDKSTRPRSNSRSPATSTNELLTPPLPFPTQTLKQLPFRKSRECISPTPTTPSVTSLELDVQIKEELKHSPELERMARNWIEAVLGEPLPFPSFVQSLKSGVVLCKLMNKLQPGEIPRINQSNIAYAQMVTN